MRQDDGVSPVIGVLIVIGIVVAVATFASVQVFNVTSEVSTDYSDGLAVATEQTDDSLTVTVVSGTTERLEVLVSGVVQDSLNDAQAGDSLTVKPLSNGDSVIIRVSEGDSQRVLKSVIYRGNTVDNPLVAFADGRDSVVAGYNLTGGTLTEFNRITSYSSVVGLEIDNRYSTDQYYLFDRVPPSVNFIESDADGNTQHSETVSKLIADVDITSNTFYLKTNTTVSKFDRSSFTNETTTQVPSGFSSSGVGSVQQSGSTVYIGGGDGGVAAYNTNLQNQRSTDIGENTTNVLGGQSGNTYAVTTQDKLAELDSSLTVVEQTSTVCAFGYEHRNGRIYCGTSIEPTGSNSEGNIAVYEDTESGGINKVFEGLNGNIATAIKSRVVDGTPYLIVGRGAPSAGEDLTLELYEITSQTGDPQLQLRDTTTV